MEIKAQFEKQMPEYAHDLKKGTPTVRLTDRELSLLNMVVIVSADSTQETIACQPLRKLGEISASGVPRTEFA